MAAWAAAFAALGGALVALLGSWGAHRWQRERERDQRRHSAVAAQANLRREVYVAYLQATQVIVDVTLNFRPSSSELNRRDKFLEMRAANPGRIGAYNAALSAVRLLASDETVKDAVEAFNNWFADETAAALEHPGTAYASWLDHEEPLIRAMRSEQQRSLDRLL